MAPGDCPTAVATCTNTRDEWLDQAPTFGGHSLIADGQLRALLAGIGAAIDDVGGRFATRYTTLAVAAARG